VWNKVPKYCYLVRNLPRTTIAYQRSGKKKRKEYVIFSNLRLNRKAMTISAKNVFQKTQSGIDGLDEITGGGLPKGRPTISKNRK
jgi:hypothetical protein